MLHKFSAILVNLSHFASNREEALSTMKWLYLFALCVALVASENPDGKFYLLEAFIIWHKAVDKKRASMMYKIIL